VGTAPGRPTIIGKRTTHTGRTNDYGKRKEGQEKTWVPSQKVPDVKKVTTGQNRGKKNATIVELRDLVISKK